MKCDSCGKEDDTVHKTIDPYQADVNDTEVEYILCDECYRDRADDI